MWFVNIINSKRTHFHHIRILRPIPQWLRTSGIQCRTRTWHAPLRHPWINGLLGPWHRFGTILVFLLLLCIWCIVSYRLPPSEKRILCISRPETMTFLQRVAILLPGELEWVMDRDWGGLLHEKSQRTCTLRGAYCWRKWGGRKAIQRTDNEAKHSVGFKKAWLSRFSQRDQRSTCPFSSISVSETLRSSAS